MYCCPADKAGAMSKQNDVALKYSGRDAELFGDGFLLALAVLIHSLDEKIEFELLDFCSFITQQEQFNPIDRYKFVDSKKSKHVPGSLMEKEEKAIIEFVKNVKIAKEKISQNFSFMQLGAYNDE